jgi:hypothetical protein
MVASKNRMVWAGLPAEARARIETLVGASVVTAVNCAGGFSPGFASRLTLTGGGRVFVKAVDVTWPMQVETYRAEARVAAALPPSDATPRLLGVVDDDWVILAFSDVDGVEPPQPWRPADVARVAAAVDGLARRLTPSPLAAPEDHPRLGGWAELAADPVCRARLPAESAWADRNLDRLIELEHQGLAAARGTTLVHCDLFPHNILLTPERVVFVDWPHARLGAPFLDAVVMLSSVAADGLDPEPYLRAGDAPAASVDAVLAAHAGFLYSGGLTLHPPRLQPIADYKLRIARGAIAWLEHRLGSRRSSGMLGE